MHSVRFVGTDCWTNQSLEFHGKWLHMSQAEF